MSEAQVTDAQPPLETQGGGASVSPGAGAMLRQARERAGLHIAALAVALKIPTRKLEALEADRYDDLPDAVFIRALALSVCRHLKLDPEPILRSLPQTNKPRLVPDESGMKVPFERPGHASGAAALWQQLPRPALMATLLLLAAALVVFLLPEDVLQSLSSPVASTQDGTVADASSAAPPASPLQAPATVLPTVVDGDAAGRAATVASVATPSAPLPVPASPAAVPAVAVAAVSQMAPATPPVPAAMPSAATAVAKAGVSAAAATSSPDNTAGRQVLQFKTRGVSWVEVVDASGTILLRRNLEAGESVGVSGALPLTVVVGRVDATEVWVRGKPFALQNLSSDNVARFEVKP